MGSFGIWHLAKTSVLIGNLMMPSILMFCPQFRPIIGGAERQAEKLAKALAKHGARIAVVTPRLVTGTATIESDSGITIYRFPIFDLSKKFPQLHGIGGLNFFILYSQTCRALSQLVESYDIVHAHGVSTLTAIALSVAKKKRKAFICKITSSGPQFDLRKLSKSGLVGKLSSKYLKKNVFNWIATTKAVNLDLINAGVKERFIFNIPNGVDIPPVTDTYVRGNVRHFLYVGRISTSCNRDFDTLIKAFFILASEKNNIKLSLVGNGDLFNKISHQVINSPYASRIFLPGAVSDPTKWYKWADCFILPSMREGMSNALIEAMSFGLVCIANDIPANREVLDNGVAGYLTPVGDSLKLLRFMRDLIGDSDEAKRLSIAAAKRARDNYSFDIIANNYLNLYDQIVSQKTKA